MTKVIQNKTVNHALLNSASDYCFKKIYGDTGRGIKGILIKRPVLRLRTLKLEKFSVFTEIFLSKGSYLNLSTW